MPGESPLCSFVEVGRGGRGVGGEEEDVVVAKEENARRKARE